MALKLSIRYGGAKPFLHLNVDKFHSYSIQAFSNCAKNVSMNNYSEICDIQNCYICTC